MKGVIDHAQSTDTVQKPKFCDISEKIISRESNVSKATIEYYNNHLCSSIISSPACFSTEYIRRTKAPITSHT